MFSIVDEKQKECVLSMLGALEKKNVAYEQLAKSKMVRIEDNIKRTIRCLKPGKGKSIKGFALDKYSRFMINKKAPAIITNKRPIEYQDFEFFCDEKIAVYTSIFGNYETIHEPDIIPDNIDYYIITDNEIKPNSRWRIRKVDLPPGLNAAQKNRYVKMHPHLLFPEYKYSIYIDGSVHILSDLTPLIHRISGSGFAMHKHSARDDVYDELIAAYYTKRITKERYRKYIDFLQQNNMPKNYGLVECGVIARNHENLLCNKIMEQWWEEYLHGINRDQICLAYVLFSNKIRISEINTLGSNMYMSSLFKILMHK